MRVYGYSEVGQYHLNAGNDICQDNHYELVINEYVAVAAVADGIGSENMSQIGSEIASKYAVQYCYDHYGEMPISNLIKSAFMWALLKVREVSEKQDIPYDQMDTTLCLVVMTPNRVYYGNVGDSGCILLKKSGELIPLTKQQNDEEGRTNVLCFESTWEFGDIEGLFVSALLCTDGIYNRIYAPFLRNYAESEEPEPVIDHDFVYAIIEPKTNGTSISDKEHIERLKKIISYTPKTISSPVGVIDDMTIVVISYDIPCLDFYTEHIDYKSCVRIFNERNSKILEERDNKAIAESDKTNVIFSKSEKKHEIDSEEMNQKQSTDKEQTSESVQKPEVEDNQIDEKSDVENSDEYESTDDTIEKQDQKRQKDESPAEGDISEEECSGVSDRGDKAESKDGGNDNSTINGHHIWNFIRR